ncbi:MAG: hypothetical protein AAF735_05055 [Myxococcota bacterium]
MAGLWFCALALSLGGSELADSEPTDSDPVRGIDDERPTDSRREVDEEASDVEVESVADLNQIVNGPGVGATTKSWQLLLFTSTAFSSGNFVSRETITDATGAPIDTVADRTGIIVQNFDVRGQWLTEAWGENWRLRARLPFDVEYTSPNRDPARRFRPFDLAIDVTDMSIINDETWGILLGGVRLTLPTSRLSRSRDRITQASLFTTLIKPFDFGLMVFAGLRLSRNWSDAVPDDCGFIRSDEGGTPLDGDASSECSAVSGSEAARSGGTQLLLESGQPNPDWEGSASLGLQYSVTSRFTVSYGLAYILSSGFSIDEDEFTSENAEGGDDIQSDFWSTSISANYLLNDMLTDLAGELPFSLSAGVTLAAFHPTTDLSNDSFLPLFYTAFRENRSAANYAQVGVDLIASY